MTTRAVAGITGAPPKRADITPSSAKPIMVKDDNDQTSVCAGNSRIPIIGNIAPAMKDNPEATEA